MMMENRNDNFYAELTRPEPMPEAQAPIAVREAENAVTETVEAAREMPVNYQPPMVDTVPPRVEIALPIVETAPPVVDIAPPVAEMAPPIVAQRPENAALAGLLINNSPPGESIVPPSAPALTRQPLNTAPPVTVQTQNAGRKAPKSKKKSRRDNRIFVGGIRRGALVAMLMVGLLLASAVGFAGGLIAGGVNPPVLSEVEPPQSIMEATIRPMEAWPASISVANPATDNNNRQALTPAQVAAIAADAVVEIVTEREVQVPGFGGFGGFGLWGWDGSPSTRIEEGAGSGVIINANGYIITNNHVIEKVSKIEVTLRNGQTYSATLVATDATTDVAVLKIEATGLTAATIGDSSALVVGEQAVVIGNPLGRLGGTVTCGIISALDRPISFDEGEGATRTMNLMQTDAAVNSGNSGGGLFNQFGELVGIVVAKNAGIGVEGLGFAIPINDVRGVIDDLISYGYARGRIALGVTLINIENEQAAFSYRVEGPGVYVYRVENNSNAERAGLKQGDRLISVNGQEITDAGQVSSIIQKLSVGDKLNMTYKREGETHTVDIIMQETVPAEAPATKISNQP